MYNLHDGSKNSLRIIETQIVQKLKNNEARPKFTCSYKKNLVAHLVSIHSSPAIQFSNVGTNNWPYQRKCYVLLVQKYEILLNLSKLQKWYFF